jgi:hypothetical protein
VAADLALFVEPGQVTELRVLQVSRANYRKPHTVAGFYDGDHLDALAKAALELTQYANGVYFVPNPLHPDLLARRCNRADVADSGSLAADKDVLRRKWLLIDADPVRLEGVSATEAEKASAMEVSGTVRDYLCGIGWPAPLIGDSGNGCHQFYRTDLPADDGDLVKHVLAGLAHRFDTAAVKIDPKVFNPSRIVKLPGTLARKGEDLPERPHRWAKLLLVPELKIVPRELLEQVAALAPKPETRRQSRTQTPPQSSGDRSRLINRAAKYLEKIPPAVSGQHGHDQTFKAACTLVCGFGLSIDEAMPLMVVYSDRCQPPWSEKELLHKLEDADKQPGPRGHLANGKPHQSGREVPPAQSEPSEDEHGDAWEPPADRAGQSTQEPEQTAQSTERTITPVVRTVANIQPRPIRWLWPGRIPRGCVTIFDGDPGLGKSTIIGADLAARVSRGLEMPPGNGRCQCAEPEDVLILSAEDDPETTIRPRLEAAGADLSRVHVLETIKTSAYVRDGVEIPESERPPVLPHDVDMIEAAMRAHVIALVVIDPLVAYFHEELDAHKDQHVRLVLFRLSKLAARTEASITGIRHLNKYGSTNAVYRGGGSIGIIGAARSGLLVAKHPEKPSTFILSVSKTNLCRMPPSLEYSIESVGDTGCIAWGEEVEITADELVAARPDRSAEAQTEKQGRKDKSDDGAVLAALDRLAARAAGQKPKVKKKPKGGSAPEPELLCPTKNQVRIEANISGDRATRALARLVDEGILVTVLTQVASGRNRISEEIGYRRPPKNDWPD